MSAQERYITTQAQAEVDQKALGRLVATQKSIIAVQETENELLREKLEITERAFASAKLEHATFTAKTSKDAELRDKRESRRDERTEYAEEALRQSREREKDHDMYLHDQEEELEVASKAADEAEARADSLEQQVEELEDRLEGSVCVATELEEAVERISHLEQRAEDAEVALRREIAGTTVLRSGHKKEVRRMLYPIYPNLTACPD